jgi:hypothetical protein
MVSISLPVLQTPSGRRGSARPLPSPVPRAPGDDSPPMICLPVFEELCVLANGDIVCWSCDPDGQHVYGNVFVDRIADVYDGPMYREIRDWQLRSRPEFWCPALKYQCPRRITPADPAAGYTVGGRQIKTLKIEPVTYCNIKCPACAVATSFVHDPEVKQRRAHKLLPLKVMLDVVDQLPQLEKMFYYNYGEPFLHKDSVPFLRAVRKQRPGIYIATNTNGLVLTPAQIDALANEALIDKIVFSIDGADPASYRKYRVGGELSKVLKKLDALVRAARAANTLGRVQVVWQYILFEWNDGDEELSRAKGLAKEIGVPIEWVMTSGYGASKRFSHGSPEIARLTEGSDSSLHMAAGTRLLNLELKKRGVSWSDVYQEVDASCKVVAWRAPGLARLGMDEPSVTAPAGTRVLFHFDVENRAGETWNAGGAERFRLGVELRTAAGERLGELPGCLLPPEAGRLSGHASAPLTVMLPERPGEYQLLIDVVDMESCYWFMKLGSQPLVCRLRVE